MLNSHFFSYLIKTYTNNILHVLPFPSLNGWIFKNLSQKSFFEIRWSLKNGQLEHKLQIQYYANPAGLKLTFLNSRLFDPVIKWFKWIRNSTVKNLSPSLSLSTYFYIPVHLSWNSNWYNLIHLLQLIFFLLYSCSCFQNLYSHQQFTSLQSQQFSIKEDYWWSDVFYQHFPYFTCSKFDWHISSLCLSTANNFP